MRRLEEIMNIQAIRSCMPAFEETLLPGLELEAAGIPVLAINRNIPN